MLRKAPMNWCQVTHKGHWPITYQEFYFLLHISIDSIELQMKKHNFAHIVDASILMDEVKFRSRRWLRTDHQFNVISETRLQRDNHHHAFSSRVELTSPISEIYLTRRSLTQSSKTLIFFHDLSHSTLKCHQCPMCYVQQFCSKYAHDRSSQVLPLLSFVGSSSARMYEVQLTAAIIFSKIFPIS